MFLDPSTVPFPKDMFDNATDMLNYLQVTSYKFPTSNMLQLYYTLVYYLSTAMVISSSYNMEHHTLRDPMKTPDNTSNHLNVRQN